AAALCPICLAADASPYERLLWNFRPLRVCTRHACLLVERCPACCRTLLPGRKDLTRCRCGISFAPLSSAKVSEATLGCARAMEGWLQPGFRGVPQLSNAAGFWLAERLAAAVGKTPSWVRRAAERFGIDPVASPDLLCWTAAVEILQAWPGLMY